MPPQSVQTESGLYNYGLSPHQLREGPGRWRRWSKARGQGREVIGVQSLAQIVFYRLSHLALGVPTRRRRLEDD